MSLISVVIPCRNEVNNIATCVKAILNSNYKEVEVLVVQSDRSLRDAHSRVRLLLQLDQLLGQITILRQVSFLDDLIACTGFLFTLLSYVEHRLFVVDDEDFVEDFCLLFNQLVLVRVG